MKGSIMKKLMTLALATMAFAMVHAADSYFRVDVDGQKEQIELKSTPGTGMKASPMGWIKDEAKRKCTVTSWMPEKLSADKWKNCELTFVPSKSGTVTIGIRGQYAAKPENRGWIVVNNMKLNDELHTNGDFKKTWKTKEGKIIPKGFWLGGKSFYLVNGGENETPAIMVNHDNGSYSNMKVEAGKSYKLSFSVKAGTPDQLK